MTKLTPVYFCNEIISLKFKTNNECYNIYPEINRYAAVMAGSIIYFSLHEKSIMEIYISILYLFDNLHLHLIPEKLT
jgi:hypothetical protein